MRNATLFKILGIFVLVAGFIVSCNKNELSDTLTQQEPGQLAKLIVYDHAGVIPDQYIVVLEKGVVSDRAESTWQQRRDAVRAFAVRLLNQYGIDDSRILHAYGSTIQGFALQMTEAQARLLAADPQVKFIESDQTMTLQGGPPGGGGGGGGGQTTPWGITRVGGAVNYTGSGRAWIIDSGIDLDHPDLNVDVANSMSFLNNDTNPEDQNGHGTHVAGTVAAINNTIGVIGVAAGAPVVAVRVLDRRGSGSYSGVIAGVDYVGGNAGNNDVANMSLGGPVSQALDNAVVAASNPCFFAIAAGNNGANANNYSPARANGSYIVTVSAMNSSDNWASWSNYANPPVDWCAPGVSIESCWKGGGYNTISGTSMATPHVAGIKLLGNIAADGTVNGDPDGNPDPIAHR